MEEPEKEPFVPKPGEEYARLEPSPDGRSVKTTFYNADGSFRSFTVPTTMLRRVAEVDEVRAEEEAQ